MYKFIPRNPIVSFHDDNKTLVVRLPDGSVEDINCKNDLMEAIEPYDYFCLFSSSVDFPEEYTDDLEVINLCRELRN